jgi:hypothetical protein
MTAPTFPGDAPATPEVGPENTAVYLDQLAEDAAKASLPVDVDYEAQARDDKGRFTKVEDVATAEDAEGDTEATAAEATAEAPDGETEAEPEAAEEVPIPLAKRDPIVPLTVKVGDKEITGLPDLMVTYTTPGGKTRTDPLDKLARLAADGIYSEQREQRFRTIEQQNLETQQMLEQYKSQLEQREAYLEQLLADETTYVAEKDAWDRQNTPEMRLERQRQQLEQERQQMELQRVAQQGEQYFTGTLTPALDLIAEAVPMVEPEELVAKVALYVRTLEGRKGYVTPDQYQQLNQFVLEEVAPWAQSLHEARTEKYGTRAAAVSTPATTAQDKKAVAVQSQKAKAVVAKAVKPVGKGAGVAPKSRPAPSSVDDAMDDAVQAAIDSVLGG